MGRNPSISEKQVLQVLRDRDRETEPVLSTTAVAERTDVSPPTAKKRLDALVDEGILRTNTYGRVPVFWPTDERITKDPDPISGGLAETVEEIAEANGEPRSAAIRRLVELGVEAEEADVRPGEMRAQFEALEEEADRHQQEAEKWQEYTYPGVLTTAGIVVMMLAVSIPSSPLSGIPFASLIFNGLQTLGAFMTLAGLVAWVWVFVKPAVSDIRGGESETDTPK